MAWQAPGATWPQAAHRVPIQRQLPTDGTSRQPVQPHYSGPRAYPQLPPQFQPGAPRNRQPGAPQQPPALQLPPSMPPRERRRKRATPFTIAFAVGAVACFGLAIGVWASGALAQSEMASRSPNAEDAAGGIAAVGDALGTLMDSVHLEIAPGDSGEDDADDRWADARAAYPGLEAWLESDDGAISTPVMGSTREDPDYYLTHDAAGNEDPKGLPYFDRGSKDYGDAWLIYGHNLGPTSTERFSALGDAWQQEAFDRLAPVTLSDAGETQALISLDAFGGEYRFTPLCALKVDGESTALTCGDLGVEEFDGYLRSTLEMASARAPDADALLESSNLLLQLSTCSGDGYPSKSRTIVLYVAHSGLREGLSEIGDAAKELSDGIESALSNAGAS